MAEIGELLSLYGLFSAILQEEVGGTLPLPAEVRAFIEGDSQAPDHMEQAQRWLALLDLCLTPPLFRTGVEKRNPDEQTVRAAIRYFMTKEKHTESDRDRLDWLLTWVFRKDEAGGGVTMFSAIRQRIAGWMQGIRFERLSGGAQELLGEVAVAIEEAGELKDFDQLGSSRLIQRGREMKENLKEEFFHPDALPAIVNYNLVFGRRFDELFAEAARHASEAVTAIRQKDYHTTGGVFRKLSEAVRRKRTTAAATAAAGAGAGNGAAAPANGGPDGTDLSGAGLTGDNIKKLRSLGIDIASHEVELKKTINGICAFVKSAGRTVRTIPLPHGSLVVSESESSAFSTEFPPTEKSFRAEYARGIQNAVACMARIQDQMFLFFESRGTSEHRWKAYHDALLYLMYYANGEADRLARLAADTQARGLKDKAAILASTVEKLRGVVQQVSGVLA